ncbi:MAG: hypothetical protein KAG53_09920 [Endozoicomonadaceae bacterium]|nr:hypothetical protein [Endozoicomonadaceae bacterium]
MRQPKGGSGFYFFAVIIVIIVIIRNKYFTRSGVFAGWWLVVVGCGDTDCYLKHGRQPNRVLSPASTFLVARLNDCFQERAIERKMHFLCICYFSYVLNENNLIHNLT